MYYMQLPGVITWFSPICEISTFVVFANNNFCYTVDSCDLSSICAKIYFKLYVNNYTYVINDFYLILKYHGYDINI